MGEKARELLTAVCVVRNRNGLEQEKVILEAEELQRIVSLTRALWIMIHRLDRHMATIEYWRHMRAAPYIYYYTTTEFPTIRQEMHFPSRRALGGFIAEHHSNPQMLDWSEVIDSKGRGYKVKRGNRGGVRVERYERRGGA
jgi:hypothetical protein